MFVRKGTMIRKGRGSGRKSVRRTGGREANGSASPRKVTIHDDPSSTGSGVYKPPPSPDFHSSNSFRMPENDSFRKEEEHLDLRQIRVDKKSKKADDKYSSVLEDRLYDNHLKPSPARSIGVTFDESRHLVQTSVGWDGLHATDEHQEHGAFLYQLHEANKEADNLFEFLTKISSIVCNTLFVTVLVGLLIAVPVAMMSIGVKYINDCPKEPRLPIYLLVGGGFGTLKLLSTVWHNMRSRRHQDIEIIYDDDPDSDGAFASNTYRTMDTVLLLFLIGWLVTGTYWMLNIWKPHFQQLLHEPSNWCEKTVYMFCVYQIFGCYGLMGIYIFILLTLSFCYRCLNCC